MNILDEISNKYGGKVWAENRGTGGGNTGGDASDNGYTKEYVKLFDKFRNDKINFLEIGIFQGRSLAMWSDYFSKGKLYGIDIVTTEFNLMKPELEKLGAFSNNNLGGIFELDSTESTQVSGSWWNPSEFGDINFDIIIDDGAHNKNAQLNTFNNFFPLLNSKGIYIVEDMNDWRFQLELDVKEHDGVESTELFDCIGQRSGHLLVIRKK